MSKKVNIIIILLLLFYCVALIRGIIKDDTFFQQDFKVYYYATEAYDEGLNPYNRESWSARAGTPEHLVFHYLPITIFFFRIFTQFEYNNAFYLLLFLKLILLFVLVALWQRKFLEIKGDVLFYVFCLLAYGMSIYKDVYTGNVSVFEQFILWLAFYFFLQRKMLLFCILIPVVSCFKITPILFLGLLLFTGERKKYIYLLASAALFAILLFVSYLATPQLFADFIGSSSGMLQEKGSVNPSTYAFLSEIFSILAEKTGIAVANSVQTSLFVGIVMVIIILSWRAIRILTARTGKDREKLLIFLSCLAYALIIPRFKDYSYILLLVPTYYLLKSSPKLFVPFFVIITLFPTPHIVLPWFGTVFNLMGEYYALLVAYAIWIIYLFKISTDAFAESKAQQISAQ